MIPLMICALVSMSVADTSLDRELSNLEYSRTIYVIENGPKLNVTSGQSKVISRRGGTVTLPCRIQRDPQLTSISTMRIKWTKDTADFLKEVKVFVAAGHRNKSYGTFQGRVHLQRSSPMDASLVMKDVTLDDYGTYRCEVMDGLEDDTAVVSLELEGVVFPYFPRLGRYNLNFNDAARACRDQDAVVASFEQLYDAWQEGMDWCNAGWLSDGTVQYPITNPREPCGGKNTPPGVRNYGLRDKGKTHYDVFCFTSFYRGTFYYLNHPSKLTYDEAVRACQKDGAQIAKVGQMFAAWKLNKYDRCDAGWLADASVRYPISNPRRRCSPTEAAVRFMGFPDKKQKLYGVYCYKENN